MKRIKRLKVLDLDFKYQLLILVIIYFREIYFIKKKILKDILT